MQVESFAPIADDRARVLVLGSMPSVASLEAGEYYGHPRNAFWQLMGELFGFDANRPYAERVDRLKDARVAVWDVLQSCRREGSLDSAIEPSSEVPNEIQLLFERCPKLGAVFLNGRKAEQGWRRYLLAKPAGEFFGQPGRTPSNASDHASDHGPDHGPDYAPKHGHTNHEAAPPWVGSLPSHTLPSTSPAMASLNFAGKLAAWSTLAEQARLLP